MQFGFSTLPGKETIFTGYFCFLCD